MKELKQALRWVRKNPLATIQICLTVAFVGLGFYVIHTDTQEAWIKFLAAFLFWVVTMLLLFLLQF